jgi:hypothetical protein
MGLSNSRNSNLKRLWLTTKELESDTTLPGVQLLAGLT